MHNILIVEDSPTVRQLLAFALKRFPNMKVVEAVNGVDALNKLSFETFDLVFADINMPVMDGLKLIGHLRNEPKYKNITIIIITTEGAEEDKNKAMALGANAYLSKPIHTNELLKIVDAFLKK